MIIKRKLFNDLRELIVFLWKIKNALCSSNKPIIANFSLNTLYFVHSDV